ncbi:uncharacterized protein LOC107013473 [Solanum pennellii]|uniref:Uncharacterized protein LOC107013473 n=1 Tax=Solanum pennellii TaxID=28526 RepID=A0ABM1GBU1_SOLPN|nr:uncharacterized protein LOC107013473 [Solanum pennellii]
MENYMLWTRAMKNALIERNKLGFVDGSITRSTYGSALGHLWDRCNAIVVSWLTSNVSRDLLSGILFRSDAHLIWKELEERGHIQSVYYCKLKDLWDEYDSMMPPPEGNCEKSKEYLAQLQYQRLLRFMMGLNDNYNQARCQILLKSKLLSVNQAYALIVQDESQKLAAISSSNLHEGGSAVFFTSKGSGSKKKNWNSVCDFCHVKGHVREDCFKLMKCDHCGKTGHLIGKCYQLIGYPSDYKVKGRNVQANHVNIQQEGLVNISEDDQYKEFKEYTLWKQMRDKCSSKGPISGASANMTVSSAEKVQLPTGEFAHISHIGNYPLSGGDSLKVVLCVPSFKFNLMSVSKDLCTGKVKVTGREQDGLYILNTRNNEQFLTAGKSMFVSRSLPDLWHRRLGHVPMAVLRKIPNRSPFEVLYGHDPSLAHMRVIGCLCYASTLPKQDKFAPRAIKSVLLGYGVHQKGYKLYNLSSAQVLPLPNQHIETEVVENVALTDQHIETEAVDNVSLSQDNHEPVPSTDTVVSITEDVSFTTSPTAQTRKSTRHSKPPTWMQDYVCKPTTNNCTYLLSDVLSYLGLSSKYQAYIAKMSTVCEPTSFKEAVKDPRWIEAMQSEIKALEEKSTWSIVDLPPGKKAIGCKWVYKIKYKATGEIERFKARLVAKGYNQKEGLDYQETFSPVVKMVAVRTVIAIAAMQKWDIHQMDVYNAFL